MPLYGTGQAVGGNFETTDTISSLLGELRFGSTGVFRYGKAGAALTAGDLCAFSNDGLYTATKGATAALPTAYGVPQGDMASGTYGWFFVGCGTFNLRVASGIGAPAKLTTTGTAGTAGAGGTQFGPVNVGTTAGAPAVIACFAPGFLGGNLYA
jgi:hypothetical protein